MTTRLDRRAFLWLLSMVGVAPHLGAQDPPLTVPKPAPLKVVEDDSPQRERLEAFGGNGIFY